MKVARPRTRASRFAFAIFAIALLLASGGGCDGDSPEAPRPGPEEISPRQPRSALDAPASAEELRSGRFRRMRRAPSPEQQEMIERLEAIGYATGSREAPELSGVVLHDPEHSHAGLNLYTSGHAPEAILIDMKGRVVHRWSHPFEESFPDHPRARNKNMKFWRRAVVFPNGDLIAIHTGFGILKLDRDSNLIWARKLHVHHDLEVAPTGEIFVLGRKGRVIPRVRDKVPVLEDFVLVLDSEGEVLRRISLLEAYENAGDEHSWADASGRFWEREKVRRRAAAMRGIHGFDVFHTNSIEILDGRQAEKSPAFVRGNVLVSMCHLDAIAVVDLDRPQVVWSMTEEFQLQHDPSMLPDGNLLVFDNHWKPDQSRVAMIDPNDGTVVWEYVGTPERPFLSQTCGNAQHLENGNVLVTESDGGRAFEVTLDHQIVWEFYNPARVGDYIATLFEVRRLPSDFGLDWLSSGEGKRAQSEEAREPRGSRGS